MVDITYGESLDNLVITKTYKIIECRNDEIKRLNNEINNYNAYIYGNHENDEERFDDTLEKIRGHIESINRLVAKNIDDIAHMQFIIYGIHSDNNISITISESKSPANINDTLYIQ